MKVYRSMVLSLVIGCVCSMALAQSNDLVLVRPPMDPAWKLDVEKGPFYENIEWIGVDRDGVAYGRFDRRYPRDSSGFDSRLRVETLFTWKGGQAELLKLGKAVRFDWRSAIWSGNGWGAPVVSDAYIAFDMRVGESSANKIQIGDSVGESATAQLAEMRRPFAIADDGGVYLVGKLADRAVPEAGDRLFLKRPGAKLASVVEPGMTIENGDRPAKIMSVDQIIATHSAGCVFLATLDDREPGKRSMTGAGIFGVANGVVTPLLVTKRLVNLEQEKVFTRWGLGSDEPEIGSFKAWSPAEAYFRTKGSRELWRLSNGKKEIVRFPKLSAPSSDLGATVVAYTINLDGDALAFLSHRLQQASPMGPERVGGVWLTRADGWVEIAMTGKEASGTNGGVWNLGAGDDVQLAVSRNGLVAFTGNWQSTRLDSRGQTETGCGLWAGKPGALRLVASTNRWLGEGDSKIAPSSLRLAGLAPDGTVFFTATHQGSNQTLHSSFVANVGEFR